MMAHAASRTSATRRLGNALRDRARTSRSPELARNGHTEAVSTCPLLGEERKSLPTFKMTAFDSDIGSGQGGFPRSR
jgi:hypothetical protein